MTRGNEITLAQKPMETSIRPWFDNEPHTCMLCLPGDCYTDFDELIIDQEVKGTVLTSFIVHRRCVERGCHVTGTPATISAATFLDRCPYKRHDHFVLDMCVELTFDLGAIAKQLAGIFRDKTVVENKSLARDEVVTCTDAELFMSFANCRGWCAVCGTKYWGEPSIVFGDDRPSRVHVHKSCAAVLSGDTLRLADGLVRALDKTLAPQKSSVVQDLLKLELGVAHPVFSISERCREPSNLTELRSLVCEVAGQRCEVRGQRVHLLAFGQPDRDNDQPVSARTTPMSPCEGTPLVQSLRCTVDEVSERVRSIEAVLANHAETLAVLRTDLDDRAEGFARGFGSTGCVFQKSDRLQWAVFKSKRTDCDLCEKQLDRWQPVVSIGVAPSSRMIQVHRDCIGKHCTLPSGKLSPQRLLHWCRALVKDDCTVEEVERVLGELFPASR